MILSREYTLKNNQKLIIRNADIDDAEQIIEYVQKVAGESDNLTFGLGEFDISLEEEKKLIASFKNSFNSIFVLGIIEDEIVGVLTLNAGKRLRICHVGEFGISVLKKFWGLGIGEALIKFMINWAKEGKIIRKINLRVRVDNHSAIELYKKMGFVQEGIRTRDMLVNGKFIDTFFMGLCIN